MDLDDKLIIKVQLNDEIRKMPIHNEEITYDELIIMMERIFKNKLNPNDEIIIKYKDEDGDLITITDDSDLVFAIECSKLLKLVLTVKNEETDSEKIEKQAGSLDLKTVRKELQLIRDYTNTLLDKIAHLNNDPNGNTNVSGRTSATGLGDYHGVGGKEFDPLSVGNQTNFHAVERTGSSASIGSNIRQEETSAKSNIDRTKQSPSQERHLESHEIQRQAPTLSASQNMPMPMTTGMSSMNASHMAPTNTQSSAVTGAFTPQNMANPSMVNLPQTHNTGNNLPPTSMAGQNIPPSSVGGQHLPPTSLASQHLPPTSMHSQYLPQSNMSGQNMPPPTMPGQHMQPPNIQGQQMQPPNMPGQHMQPPNIQGQQMQPPNMPGQHMQPQNIQGQQMQHPNMPGQHMQPPNIQGQQMQPPNMPGQQLPPPSMPGHNLPPPNIGAPNMSGFNPVSQNDGSGKMPGYMGQPMQSPMNTQRPGFYSPSNQPRPALPGNMMANGQQGRPNMPPTGPTYFNPQGVQQGGQMFNPQVQQSPQNSPYGYQPNK